MTPTKLSPADAVKGLRDMMGEGRWAFESVDDESKAYALLEAISAGVAAAEARAQDYGNLYKFTQKVENFDYIYRNHSDVPHFYIIMTKGHYATLLDDRKVRKEVEGRLAAAETQRKAAKEIAEELIEDWPPETNPESSDPNSLDAQWLKLLELRAALGGGEAKPFKAYLRCKEPSETCPKCGFLKQCKELNPNTVYPDASEEKPP